MLLMRAQVADTYFALRTHQQHGVGVIGLGREISGIGAFDGAAETPPEIDLPPDIETHAGLPEHRIAGAVGAGLVLFEVQALPTQLLQLWITPGLDDGQLRPGLGDAQAGQAQAGVIGVGLGDQCVQGRVGKHCPPLAQLRLLSPALGLLEQGRAPAVQPRMPGRLIVRADLGATGQHHQQAQPTAAPGHGRPWLRLPAARVAPAPARPPIARTARRSQRGSPGRGTAR
ncbi:hypothetical protein D3C78_638110 [compost metagenome]